MATICTITGTIKDVTGTAIEGVIVQATMQDFTEHGTDLIAPYRVVDETDASGNFTLAVIETTTISKTMRVQLITPDGSGGELKKTYTITVPNQATANFEDLIS